MFALDAEELFKVFGQMSTIQKLELLADTSKRMLAHHVEDHKNEKNSKYTCGGVRATANGLIPLLASLADPDITMDKINEEAEKEILKAAENVNSLLNQAKDITKGGEAKN